MSEERDSRTGRVLAGKYRLAQRLGGGGMGEVYRARNELVGRDVAIKLLREEYAKSPDIVARFLREARAANAVHHPNVVDVVDIDADENGSPFIVQELLHGHDLGDHLSQHGQMSVAALLQVMVPVTEAVALAHSRGVVHRDLKPENVFLHKVGDTVVPKVLDFGLAKVLAPEGNMKITSTGVTMGTPAYMSPEQVQGARDIDARTDVWALGAMMYELLTRQVPFQGESPGAMFVKICTADATPITQHRTDLPPEVCLVIERCLRRDLSKRYRSAGELARDLRHLRAGESVEPTGVFVAGSVPDPGTVSAEWALHPAVPAGMISGPMLGSDNGIRGSSPHRGGDTLTPSALMAVPAKHTDVNWSGRQPGPQGRSRAMRFVGGGALAAVLVAFGAFALHQRATASADTHVARPAPPASAPAPAVVEAPPPPTPVPTPAAVAEADAGAAEAVAPSAVAQGPETPTVAQGPETPAAPVADRDAHPRARSHGHGRVGHGGHGDPPPHDHATVGTSRYD